jgi:hypothetical protein
VFPACFCRSRPCSLRCRRPARRGVRHRGLPSLRQRSRAGQ